MTTALLRLFELRVDGTCLAGRSHTPRF
jgi:hypothetical protein